MKKHPRRGLSAQMRHEYSRPAGLTNKIWKILIPVSVLAVVLTVGLILLIGHSSQTDRPVPLLSMDSRALDYYFRAQEQTGVSWVYIAALDRMEVIPAGDIDMDHALEQAYRIEDAQDQAGALPSLPEGFDNLDELWPALLLKDDSKGRTYYRTIGQLQWLDITYSDHIFPFARGINFDYANGFGEGRNFDGERRHEGIDIFAAYGTPILSTCKGVVEKMGWNRLGGWRVGVRGEDGLYYYYAHMSEYADDLEEGMQVEPGTVLGYVGDSGYGPEGTTGKFEPHLHLGIYEGLGDAETACNVFPFLLAWERMSFPNLPARSYESQ